MKTLLPTSLAAIALLAAAPANAEDIYEQTYIAPEYTSVKMAMVETVAVSELPVIKSTLPPKVTIAVARVDGGRLIPTPFGEAEDWTFLDRRVDANIIQLGAAKYIEYVPEIPLEGTPSHNTIDEIRLTAANEGLDYVLIYGVGPDANWASFGGKALVETGLTVKPDCAAWDAAKAKALLVDSYSGQVLGAVTADNIEFNIGELADRVEGLIEGLTMDDTFARAEPSGAPATKDI